MSVSSIYVCSFTVKQFECFSVSHAKARSFFGDSVDVYEREIVGQRASSIFLFWRYVFFRRADA